MDPKVVDAGVRDLHRLAQEAGDDCSGHLKTDDLIGDCANGLVGSELQSCSDQVAIEDHVKVLIHGDASEQPFDDGLAGIPACVAVRDPRGQLLERHVRQALKDRLLAAVIADLHDLHPCPLEPDRVHPAGDQQVVTNAVRVPALLRRPAMHPGAPGALAAKDSLDLPVIAREVVLRQQVDLERRTRDRRQRRLLAGPCVAAEVSEVATLAPRHVLVRHPFLRRSQVPVEVGLYNWLELAKQA